MRKEDLFTMELGKYVLTDGIYKYELDISLTDEGERCYDISGYGSLPFSAHIFMVEDILSDEYGEEKILSAMSGVGGLIIHSDDTFSMLKELSIYNM